MRSIRSFLLWRLLGGSALILAAAGAGAYFVVAGALEAQFDSNLCDRVQGFASILFQVSDQVECEFSGELMPEYEGGRFPDYFEIRFADGRLLERSATLGDAELVVPAEPDFDPIHWSAPLPDGRPGRHVAQLVKVHHVYPEEGPDRPRAAVLSLVIGRGREPLVAAERTLIAVCAGASLVLIALIAFLSWRTVDRSLEPAGRLATAVDRIRVDELPGDLDVGRLPDELEPIAAMIRALVGRVETALERERRTAADIAHELRTPISELLTTSEVALRNGRDPRETQSALRTVRDVAWRMGGSISTLLKLARLEMGAETFAREDVDLGAILAEQLRSLAAVALERRLSVSCRVAPGDRVMADGEALRIVASNLLSNAYHYSPPGDSVACTLEDRGDGWRLVFENGAGDLRSEDLQALCEPFWRKDASRVSRDRSGLGLALSHALAERTGMELSFALEQGRFRAILRERPAQTGPERRGTSAPAANTPGG